jgi:serine/threonine-protein kinase
MSQPDSRGPDLEQTLKWVDQLAADFEQAWERGTPPRIAEFLGTMEGERLIALLRDLIKIDIDYRRRFGMERTLEEYLSDFPVLKDGTNGSRQELETFVTEMLARHAEIPGSSREGIDRRYRPLRFLAEGGLGRVFVARDEEVGREVALKRIKEGKARDDNQIERFRREAEITGRLEHPGIVPVYGLGVEAGGRPFYVMRLIRGESLQDALATFFGADRVSGSERDLTLRRLVDRLIAACNAVAYAHSRGVIHRDLKPANIMLGKYGETLVVDWGLAKLVGRDEVHHDPVEEILSPSGGDPSDTAPGSPMGTPGFMSPEQAKGEWDGVGPATDVFGLGATLYAVLTGEAPFRSLAEARTGTCRPPRQLRPDVPPALQAVCLTAMAPRPEDRYATVLELGRDLERWLGDEPIPVYPEPLKVRAWRWVKRRRTLVATGVALLLTGTISLLCATLLLHREQKRTEEALQSALVSEENAKSQQQRAEANFAKARSAADKFWLTQIVEDLDSFDGLKGPQLLEKLRDEPLLFYQIFLDDTQTDPAARAERARAHGVIAAIHALAARHAESEAAFGRACGEYEKLAEEYPRVPEYLQKLARLHLFHGRLLESKPGRLAEAEAALRQGIRCCERLAADFPDAPTSRRDLGRAYHLLGALFEDVNARQEDAASAYLAALQLRLKEFESAPRSVEVRRELSLTHNNLGWVLYKGKEPAKSEPHYQAALELLRQLVKEFPRDVRYRQDLGRTEHNLGNLYRKLGRRDDALAAFSLARDVRLQLLKEVPGEAEYGSYLAWSQFYLGEQLGNSGRLAEAVSAHLAARDLRQRLAEQFPGDPEYRRQLAFSYQNLGWVYQRWQHGREAETAYRQARDLRQRLVEQYPNKPMYRSQLALTCSHLGSVLLQTGRPKEAEEECRKSVVLFEKLIAENYRESEFWQLVSGAYNNLGGAGLALGDALSARAAFEKSLAICRKAAQTTPGDIPVQIQLARTSGELGGVELANYEPEKAREWYEKARTLLRTLEKAGKISPAEHADWLKGLEDNITFCRAAEKAIAESDFALKQPADQVHRLLVMRGAALARRGKHAEAAATAEKLAERGPKDPAVLYDACCLFALCSASAKEGASHAPHADRAVILLGQAIRNGYKDVAHLERDTDLTVLRTRADFQKLLDGLREGTRRGQSDVQP